MARTLLRAHADNLEECAVHAAIEKAAGHTYVYFEVEPNGLVGKYIQLWSGIVGEVCGRRFYEDDEKDEHDTAIKTIQPDLIEFRTTRALIVRIQTIDVIEALRREKKAELTEFKSAIPANRQRTPPASNTAR